MMQKPIEEMDNREIVDACNALARKFYEAHGYEVEEVYRFDRAHHPQENGMWTLACIAFCELLDTDPADCLYALDEDEEERERA